MNKAIDSLSLKSKAMLSSSGAKKFYSSLACILLGLLVGFIILLCLSPMDAAFEFFTMITGGLLYFKVDGIFSILTRAAPLICCGLSICFAYKAGMFNIGAAGQYVIGVFGSLFFALYIKAPWYVCILMAMFFSSIYAAIPGFLKSFFNVNEVISGIMLNWIGLFFVNYSFQTYLSSCVDVTKGSKTFAITKVNPSAAIPDFGLKSSLSVYFNIAIFIAVLVAIIIHLILNKTTLGYRIKASGMNRHATRYAGMNDKASIMSSMAISGALAGLGAALYYLSGIEEWSVQASSALPALPWNGIVVAFIGQLSPIACIFTAIFTTMLSVGARAMTQTIFPAEIADLITGIVVYLSGLTNLFFMLLTKYVFEREKPIHKVKKGAN